MDQFYAALWTYFAPPLTPRGMYVRYPLSLRQVEDLLFERGIDVCHETVRYWWNRFGPLFAGEIRRRRVGRRNWSNWRWHLDEVFVRINGETHYLWRAVDHEGEVLESCLVENCNVVLLLAARAFEGPLGVRVEDKRQRPPRLHDLPSLQKLCSAWFGWPASKTLEVAQELYDIERTI